MTEDNTGVETLDIIEESDIAFNIYLSKGNATEKHFTELFDSISELNKSYGGNGMKFKYTGEVYEDDGVQYEVVEASPIY
jgi:hypothetical protein